MAQTFKDHGCSPIEKHGSHGLKGRNCEVRTPVLVGPCRILLSRKRGFNRKVMASNKKCSNTGQLIGGVTFLVRLRSSITTLYDFSVRFFLLQQTKKPVTGMLVRMPLMWRPLAMQ